MGRMLETLKLGNAAKPPSQDCVVDWSMREAEEVPFIEVGGGKKIEGSANVLAVKHPPQQPVVQPPHPPTEKILTAGPKLAELPEARPMTVAFEPWPAGLAQTRGVAQEVIAYHRPEHAISKQYASLLERMLEGLTEKGTPALLLCGGKSQVGATTVLLNLAVVAAHGKRRLALVDMHLSRPSLAQRLGLTPAAGVQEILAGHAALEPAILKTLVAGLHVLAARAEESTRSSGQASSKALAWLLAWMKERFDLLLIDGPALDEPAELAPLAPLCDGAYLVVPKADAQPPKTMAHSLARSGGRLKGVIHTHFEV